MALLHGKAAQTLFARGPFQMTVVYAFTRRKKCSTKAGTLPRSATSAHVSPLGPQLVALSLTDLIEGV